MKFTPTRTAAWIFLAVSLVSCEVEDDSDDQLDVATVRAFIVEGLEKNKEMDIEFARAIPDSALRWAPNADVRDFAEQVVHAADNAWVASGLGIESRTFGDTAVVLNDNDALAEAVAQAYDWILNAARELPDEEFTETVEFFGAKIQRWRVFMEAIEHATWTRGQLVPYFHAHGVPVPEVQFF
ncbi:MAG: DinB family protein [Gemmatimonadales bacterium]